ncbi:MAG: hypothetical protein GX363_08425, partial [Clostridiales bacterium]|nr:hypothetical protein [Clostridiales bacterium]
SEYSQEAIARVEEWINGLPRKILGYKTPEELFDEELDNLCSLTTEICQGTEISSTCYCNSGSFKI